MPRVVLIMVLLLIYCGLKGQTFPVKAILENGPRDKRINMIFLSEGYKITEMDKYHGDVQATSNKIFLTSPYKEYKNLFNVYAIEVPSNESGTSHPGTATDCGELKDSIFTHDTYFKTTFDAGSIHRLLVANNGEKVSQVLMNNFPDYDIVMMVVNHEWYGGSGGEIAVYSTNYFSAEVAIHENGHSFARLADEYDYGVSNPVQYDGINVTWRTQRDSIPWNKWILQTTPLPTPPIEDYSSAIGLFEGAFYTSEGMYRPKLHCRMRVLNVPFCEVCTEQHVKSMFSYVELIDGCFPQDESDTLYTSGNNSYSISRLQLPFNELTIDWVLDTNVVAQNTDSISLDGSILSLGDHILSVKVKHLTQFVKNDTNKLLESSVRWFIHIVHSTGVVKGDEIPQKYILGQNYPNPFNPITSIIYSIPKPGFVLLKVYDILGKEVATLVNEEKGTGKYKVEFNGTSLSNGLYFYRIQAGKFIDTKKFLLVK